MKKPGVKGDPFARAVIMLLEHHAEHYKLSHQSAGEAEALLAEIYDKYPEAKADGNGDEKES